MEEKAFLRGYFKIQVKNHLLVGAIQCSLLTTYLWLKCLFYWGHIFCKNYKKPYQFHVCPYWPDICKMIERDLNENIFLAIFLFFCLHLFILIIYLFFVSFIDYWYQFHYLHSYKLLELYRYWLHSKYYRIKSFRINQGLCMLLIFYFLQLIISDNSLYFYVRN